MKLAFPHQIPLNPNLIKSKFTKSFLQSLLKISRDTSNYDIFERCDRVKTAADQSLASAVGSRRAWSRAMLFKIRHHNRRHKWQRHLRHRAVVKRRNLKKYASFDEAKKLRKVVPGGEAMDLCNLLDEAAHYVMCLSTQVQVMTCIADLCSSTT